MIQLGRKLAAAGLLTGLMVISLNQSVMAQTAPLPGIGIKLGEDIATVKAALKTQDDVEPIPRNPLLPPNLPDVNRGKTVLHLRTKGIWVFFNAAGTAETIRFDAPFSGEVLGVKIGDPVRQVTAKLGQPIRKPTPALMNMQMYQYVIDDSAYAEYVTNDDGVQIIFIKQ